MSSQWYSVIGNPSPIKKNKKREKVMFLRLRPKNITATHAEQAAQRISTHKVEAARLPGSAGGMIIGLFSREESLSWDEIEEIVGDLHLHLTQMLKAPNSAIERRRRREAVDKHLRDNNREVPPYVNTPPRR